MKLLDTDNMILSTLPPLATADADERFYLRTMLALIKTGDMMHGKFVEVHVARLIGGHIPDTGITPYDIWVPHETRSEVITVEVKATTFEGSFSVGGTKSADVWVFVAFENKAEGPKGYKYVVATGEQVAALGKRTMRSSKVFAAFGGAIRRSQLADAVQAAAG